MSLCRDGNQIYPGDRVWSFEQFAVTAGLVTARRNEQ
jgi:hypothetical protein